MCVVTPSVCRAHKLVCAPIPLVFENDRFIGRIRHDTRLRPIRPGATDSICVYINTYAYKTQLLHVECTSRILARRPFDFWPPVQWLRSGRTDRDSCSARQTFIFRFARRVVVIVVDHYV